MDQCLNRFQLALDFIRCRHGPLSLRRELRQDTNLTRPSPYILSGRALPPSSGFQLGLKTKHRRMVRLENFAIAEVHVHAARQAGIKATNGAYDKNKFELERTILLKDR